MGWSVVCDCGITWSSSLTFFTSVPIGTSSVSTDHLSRPEYELCVHITLSSNGGPGKPVHMRKLASTFIARIHKVWMGMKTLSSNFSSLDPLDTAACLV